MGISIPHGGYWMKNQEAKADNGKIRLTWVPRKILMAIGWVRMFGNRKYKDPENWKTVEKERYMDALLRHLIAYLNDPTGKDKESGLPHLFHVATNVAFLLELEEFDERYFDCNTTADSVLNSIR